MFLEKITKSFELPVIPLIRYPVMFWEQAIPTAIILWWDKNP